MTVSVRAGDPQGVAWCTLWWSVDDGAWRFDNAVLRLGDASLLGQQRQAVGEKITQLGIPSRVSRHNMGVDRTLYKRPSTLDRALLQGVSARPLDCGPMAQITEKVACALATSFSP